MKDNRGFKGWSAPGVVLITIVGVTLLRIAHLEMNLFPLFGDEGQYWSWSLEPAFGYFSKPPMVACLISATTTVAGHGELGVKLASPLTHAVTALMLFLIGCRLGGGKAGLWGSLLYLTMPAVSYSCAVISTDPPLLMFWSVALYGFIRALDVRADEPETTSGSIDAQGAVRWWLVTGIALGLALLSRYTAVAFPVSMLLFLAFTPRRRSVLRSPGPYLALAVAMIVFLPNLLWNAEHGFVSVLHLRDNAHWVGGFFHPGRLAEFFFAQFGVFGPLPFLCLLEMLRRWRRLAGQRSLNLLLWFVAPLLFLICCQALVSRAYANWAAPVYVAASAAVAIWLLDLGKERWIKATVLVHVVLGLALAAYEPLIRAFDVNVPARFDLLRRVRGWPEVGGEVKRLMEEYPGTLLLVNDRMVMAECLYYGGVPLETAYSWNPSHLIRHHYDLVTGMDDALDRDFIFVTATPMTSSIAACFDQVQTLTPIVIATHRDRSLRFYVYRLTRFRGYEQD